MSTEEIDAVVGRLVAQFSSPYDFLRELVQNSVDAGSDLVDVRLHVHAGDRPGRSVFELEVADAGAGMDETILDTQFTRLFSSSKTGDRTMAGGFGIGFVSVFAWKPARVLVQTGRRDEAWELLFYEDRRFEKHRVEAPAEGTVIRLFREGDDAERPSIAAAIRESLMRWCRYSSSDITFEDVGVDPVPHVIEAEIMPSDAVATVERTTGETTLRAAFTSMPEVTYLRHGLVLVQGEPEDTLRLEPRFAASAKHLWAWADSPRLKTSMARDQVIADAGRQAIEGELLGLLPALRETLVLQIEELAHRGDASARFSQLHGHLHLEHPALDEAFLGRGILRAATGDSISVRGLAMRARLGLAGVVEPGPADSDALAFRVAALRAGVPILEARWEVDAPWLRSLLALVGKRVAPLDQICTRAGPARAEGGLCVRLHRVLVDCGAKPRAVRYADFSGSKHPPLAAVGDEASVGIQWLDWSALDEEILWLDVSHPLVVEARTHTTPSENLAVLALAHGLTRSFHSGAPTPEVVTEAWAKR